MEIDLTDQAQAQSKRTGYSEAYSEKGFWKRVSALSRSVIIEEWGRACSFVKSQLR